MIPNYKKIEIPDKPENYDSKSRRCTECDFLWPDHNIFPMSSSPCCNVVMRYIGEGPDLKWEEVISKFLECKFVSYYENYINSLPDEDIFWLDGNAKEPTSQYLKDLDQETDSIVDKTTKDQENDIPSI